MDPHDGTLEDQQRALLQLYAVQQAAGLSTAAAAPGVDVQSQEAMYAMWAAMTQHTAAVWTGKR